MHTIGCGKLDEDAVAAQGDDEGLLAHSAALRLTGHRALEHTYIFIYKERRRHKLAGPGRVSKASYKLPLSLVLTTNPLPSFPIFPRCHKLLLKVLPCALPAQPMQKIRW